MTILSSLPKEQWPARVDECLLINVRKDKRWAVFVVTSSMANCLLRPGVLDYTGPASGWLEALPKRASEQRGDKVGYKLSTRGRPMRAPEENGLIVLDYDAKTFLSCQDVALSTEVNMQMWGFMTRNAVHPERQWIQALSQTGHLKTVQWQQGRVDALPMPPADVLDPIAWWERTLFKAHGMPPPESYPDAFSVPASFPLQVPGWSTMLEVNLNDAHLILEVLLPTLSAEEVGQWSQWAQSQEREGVVGLLRRAQTAEDLDHSLPQLPQARPARPRM